MFIEGYTQIKTTVKLSSDFHRDKKERKKGDEVHTKDDEEDDRGSLKHGHFTGIKKRISKIYKKLHEVK